MAVSPLDRNGMAAWCARDIPEGWLVNLGIGIPTLVADFVPAEREVIFHAENGVIGVGPPISRVGCWWGMAGGVLSARRRRI